MAASLSIPIVKQIMLTRRLRNTAFYDTLLIFPDDYWMGVCSAHASPADEPTFSLPM